MVVEIGNFCTFLVLACPMRDKGTHDNNDNNACIQSFALPVRIITWNGVVCSLLIQYIIKYQDEH